MSDGSRMTGSTHSSDSQDITALQALHLRHQPLQVHHIHLVHHHLLLVTKLINNGYRHRETKKFKSINLSEVKFHLS